MKKLLLAIISVMFPVWSHAGTMTIFQNLGGNLGTITTSSGPFSAPNANAFINAQHDHVSFVSGATTYMAVGGITQSLISTTVAQVPYHTAGVADKMYCFMISNDIDTASTITLQKNDVDTAMTITLPADTTGAFENTSASVSIADGDKLNWKLVNGSGGTAMNYNGCMFRFTPTNTGVSTMKFVGNGFSNQTNWWPVWYNQIAWTTALVNQTTEVGFWKVQHAGTFGKMSVHISTNANLSNTNFTLRKNAADTALTVAVPTNQIGLFENTSSEVAVVAGDSVTFSVSESTPGDGNMTPSFMSMEFTTTDGIMEYYTGSTNKTIAAGDTSYTTWLGPLGVDSTPASYEIPSRVAATISSMRLYVSTNTLSGTLVVTMMKNQVATGVTVTVGAGLAGIFDDAVNTVSVAATDKISFRLVAAAGTGTATTRYIATLVENTE